MAENSGKRKTKTHNVTQPTASEVLLLAMSGTTANTDLEEGSSTQPLSEGLDAEGTVAPPRQRMRAVKKKNYTDAEMELLVDEVLENFTTLFPAKNDNCPMVVRSAAWANILVKVNALGVAKRTVPELKKKWADLKKNVKAKMAAISRYARQTGGGPACPDQLTPMEEKVGSTFGREQIEGFGSADVCSQALNTSQTLIPDRNEDNNDEDEPLENIEEAQGVAEEHHNPNLSSTLNTSTPREELFLPADLGLSETQTTYLNDYTNEHLSFMRRVDTRLETLEHGLNKLADAYILGANTISQGLSKLANILETKTCAANVNIESPSHLTPQSFPNTTNATEINQGMEGSPYSAGTQHTVGSTFTFQAREHQSVTPSQSVSIVEEYSSDEAIDLTISKTSQSVEVPGTNIQESPVEPPSSTAMFLLSCKQELAASAPEEAIIPNLPPSKVPRKKLGTSRKGKCVAKK